ncbi:hypothetical protein NUW58_g6280 [Xylaria curta]|uniref:Uncharacterized protein n=1 Tax=Xylaria curta TaxID=42375 RepID=A0ACC1NWK0_9PEZI|nr:hypothetical protein NUW58_g6280 [Xylaria curta]
MGTIPVTCQLSLLALLHARSYGTALVIHHDDSQHNIKYDYGHIPIGSYRILFKVLVYHLSNLEPEALPSPLPSPLPYIDALEESVLNVLHVLHSHNISFPVFAENIQLLVPSTYDCRRGDINSLRIFLPRKWRASWASPRLPPTWKANELSSLLTRLCAASTLLNLSTHEVLTASLIEYPNLHDEDYCLGITPVIPGLAHQIAYNLVTCEKAEESRKVLELFFGEPILLAEPGVSPHTIYETFSHLRSRAIHECHNGSTSLDPDLEAKLLLDSPGILTRLICCRAQVATVLEEPDEKEWWLMALDLYDLSLSIEELSTRLDSVFAYDLYVLRRKPELEKPIGASFHIRASSDILFAASPRQPLYTAPGIGAYFQAVERFQDATPPNPPASNAVDELVLVTALIRCRHNLFTKALPLLLTLRSQTFAFQPDTKRVVQYYGLQTNDQGSKFHIDLLVNNTDNRTYATNVLMGEFDINKTMRLNGGDPDEAANDWFWDEIKTVQDAGVKVSMWLRQGYELLKANNSVFDPNYALVKQTIIKHGLDGIDLDIEDGEGSCNDESMNLHDTVHLIRQLRADFGPDFIITLAPVSNALLDEGSVSCFSYRELEKAAAATSAGINGQFYGGSWTGLKTPGYYERCISEGGWKPERIVTTVYTSSDFTHPQPRWTWVGLNETGPTIETLAAKYADFGGVGGFDFYDAEPGGYEHPWEWSRWAARRMGV